MATVSNVSGSQGLLTDLAVGTAIITATLNSVSGVMRLNVFPPTLVSLSLTPVNPTIARGTTEQFKATGTFTDGSTDDLTSSVSWASLSTGVATISATGLASGAAVGAATIMATSGAVSAMTSLKVTPAALVSVTVTPISQSIPKGTTQQFTATGTYTDNTKQVLTTLVKWSSSNTSVAAVSNDAGTQGLATGTTTGTATITATDAPSSISGTAPLTVSPAALEVCSPEPA